jgi:hypothetical protein
MLTCPKKSLDNLSLSHTCTSSVNESTTPFVFGKKSEVLRRRGRGRREEEE